MGEHKNKSEIYPEIISLKNKGYEPIFLILQNRKTKEDLQRFLILN